MKICICTTPIRPVHTNYPPFGSLAIIQALREIGEHASFYNIDYFRYPHEQIKVYFAEHQFDMVCISAVVSTAYAYTKYLSNLIHLVSPDTVIIVGGNLAASSEILLRKCKIDICVVGDGELIIQDLVPVVKGKSLNFEVLKEIKGICFLDANDEFCFTGYGAKRAAEEITWPDYGILDADGSLPYFISDRIDEAVYGYEGVIEPGKRIATVVMAKGCVARCTFCHRFEKGYRARPADQVIQHVRYLMEHHNVGVITIADENFGSNKKVAKEIASRLGELGVIWSVAGVRTRTVTKESLQHWKDNGCYMVLFGVESGSQKILNIMEKNATLEQNTNAIKWTGEVGLGTVIQLVLGMPGEDDKTIQETIEFLKDISSSMKWWKGKVASELISINYAQALPGTPLYEYGRQHGFIGGSLDEEEQYLISISDTDAYKEDHFVNSTGLPLLKVLMWRPMILACLDAHHYQAQSSADLSLSLLQVIGYYGGWFSVRLGNVFKRKFNALLKRDAGKSSVKALGAGMEYITESGYFNIHSGLKFSPLLFNTITKRFFYPLLAVAIAGKTSHSPIQALKMLFDHMRWSLNRGPSTLTPDMNSPVQEAMGKSLRKTITIVASASGRSGEDHMLPLRSGR